jgi:hypothetical protein
MTRTWLPPSIRSTDHWDIVVTAAGSVSAAFDDGVSCHRHRPDILSDRGLEVENDWEFFYFVASNEMRWSRRQMLISKVIIKRN